MTQKSSSHLTETSHSLLMQNERGLYRYLRSRLPQAHWQRFENAVGMGQPDVNVAYLHKEVWLELKHGNSVLLQPSQFAWLHQRHNHNPNVYVWQYHVGKEEHRVLQPPFEGEVCGKYVKVVSVNKKIVNKDVNLIFKNLFYLPT